MQRLGRTDLVVSEVGFGAIPIIRLDRSQAVDVLRHAWERGINFFDTANAYRDSEEKIGAAFAGMRDRVILATKTLRRDGDGVREHLERSLKMLQTDYLDLYQLHQIAQDRDWDAVMAPGGALEVVARARAVLRRTRSGANQPEPSGLAMDRDNFCASLEGKPLSLTPVEFSLLNTLSSHPGRVYSRDQLMNEMYSDYRVVSDRAVDTHIKNLRRKLAEAAPEREWVESVYGLGYRFIG